METISETEFGKFIVLKNDFIGKWMMTGRHFEKECIDQIIKYLSSGDIIIDVGANIGCYTVPFSKKVGLRGRVYSFEPQGRICNILKNNVYINNIDHIAKIYHMAVGHENTKTTLNKNCDRNRYIMYDREEETNFGGINLGKGGEVIDMITLDQFVENENIDKVKFIKIDVEGAEPLVIFGAKKLITRDRPIVFFEKNFKTITPDMIETLNLPDHIINFDIIKFFTNLNYSQIINITNNFLCIP